MVEQRNNVDVGDARVARANEILRTEVGSGAHGMAIAGTDDHDELGVYVEEPTQLLGLAPNAQHWIWRSQPMGARSGPGDLDLTMFSLRKFMRLALAGNPTVLIPFYAGGRSLLFTTPLGDELRALAPQVVSRRASLRFLGYLDGQRRRMLGLEKRSRVPNRPELVARHGYDTKYASHALRLGRQGVELTTTGHLTLPMPAADLEQCLAVKRGEVDEQTALNLIDAARADLAAAIEGGGELPLEPDAALVDDWLVDAHRRRWHGRGL